MLSFARSPTPGGKGGGVGTCVHTVGGTLMGWKAYRS